MPRFRPPTGASANSNVDDLFAVGQLIDDAMRPGHFFVDPSLSFSWIAARAETIPWEIFRGRLLDRTQTREQRAFLSWHMLSEPDAEPTISVKLDVETRRIFVTRGLLAYVWEPFDAGAGVIESREAAKWTRELVGTIELADFSELESLRDELICLIWQAVVGTSRLPLMSVEAPLPAFSFGQLHYVHRHDAQDVPMRSLEELVACFDEPGLAQREVAKLMEFGLRNGTPGAFLRFLELFGHKRVLSMAVFREMFNGVSLSPHTRFVDHALISIGCGAQLDEGFDFFAHLLNQLHRHLSAYDLVTFHHRGANYPDALLLDAVLGYYVKFGVFTELFDGEESRSRKRRRALRHACMMRRLYEGHLVPDAPTSPGENARVLPASHPRVPEEQLLQTVKRQRKLFADEPLATVLTPSARDALARSVADLVVLDERIEMGLGLFIDRPLGYAKQIGEPDLTPMLAHEAFSPSLARRRWQELKKLCKELEIVCDANHLDELFANGPWPAGLPHAELAECPRPVAALTDVRKVAADFVILRTLPRGLNAFLELWDWQPLLNRYHLSFLAERRVRMCVQALDETNLAVLAIFDVELRRRVEFVVDLSGGYRTRAGLEWPRAGLVLKTVWDDDKGKCDGDGLVVRARD